MAIVAVMAMAWCCRRNWGVHVLFAFGVFMVTLFPVLGFFRMYFLLFSRVSDHWQYLALMASISLLFGAVVCWFRKFGAKLPAFVGPVLACAVLALLVGATFTRAEVFTSEEKLWTDTISKNPNASMPHNNLAFGLLARGDVSGAFSHFNEALKLRPNSAESYFGLANIFAGQGNISEAVRLYSRVIELRSNYPEAHFNLANTLLAAGDPIDAIAHYRAALQFQPENGVIHNNLANVFAQQGNYAEAETHYREAVRLNGGYFEARVNLANILVAQHRLAEAISIYNEALAMQPSNVELNCNLADALAQQGDLAQAVTLTEKALQLAVAQQRTRIVPLVQARLSRYREGSSGVSP
jgi:tetratricopeptide (TPR) repeat protein